MAQSRPSLFGALLLILIGVLLLVPHPKGFWYFVAHYWPVLLILWGAIRLIEFFLPASASRSGLSGGEIVLIIFLVFAGGMFSVAYQYRNSSFANWIGFHRAWYWGNHYAFKSTADAELSPGMRVSVRGERANITLVAGPALRLQAENSATVYASDEARARSRFRNHPLSVERRGGELIVWPTGQNSGGRTVSNLRLTLPPATPVEIELRSGNLNFQGWKARLAFHTGEGSVQGSGLSHSINIQHSGGDISLSNVQGGVQVQGDGGDVRLNAIAGPVHISGDYTGFVELSHLRQAADFISGRAHIGLAQLPGKLTWSIGHLTIEQGAGIHIVTRDQDVTLNDFRQGLRVEDRDGSLQLTAARLDGAIQASTREGDITLALPPGAGFDLTASAGNGRVHSDFPLMAPGGAGLIRAGKSSGQVQGRAGKGGPAISLSTTDGTIQLKKMPA